MDKLGFSDQTLDLLSTTICCNTPDKCGPTDLAMVNMLNRANVQIKNVLSEHRCPEDRFIRFPFTSGRKRMSTITQNHGLKGYNKRVQIKGASEIVCRACSHYIDQYG